jgi:VWFA-related protein
MKMPPNIFSNRFDRSAAAPSTITVILIDGLNTEFLDQKLVSDNTIKVLDSLQPDDRVAVYLFGMRGLRVLHDFTSDFEQLRAALRQRKGEHSGSLAASDALATETGLKALDGMFEEQNQQIAAVAMIDRARRTTDALTAIARHISIIPGRKNLIWVSGSFPIGVGTDLDSRTRASAMPSLSRNSTPATQVGGMPDAIPTLPFGGLQSPQLFTDELRKSWRALNDANVAVYPVDARGLQAPELGIAPGTKPSMAPPRGIDSMRLLADQTGGKAYFNTNDLTGAMRSAIDDGRATYTLGFYVTADDLDGKFHDVKVKVARPGVDLRHRTGYRAIEELQRSDRQIEEDLRTAAVRPLDITELGVSARADMLPGDAPALRVAVSIDFSDVRIEKTGDRWIGKLELFLFQIGADGSRLDATSAVIPLSLTEADFRNAAREGMVVSKTLKPAPDAREIRVLVLDRGSGKIGSLRMPMGPILAAAKK